MRLILFAGKGGTGKTSLAAATGALAARRGARTLIMSLDPAHSLGDAFDLDVPLMEVEGEPLEVAPNLSIQEINVNQAIQQYWQDVHNYLSLLFSTAGLGEVVADEVAVLPGMEELCALLYINRYVNEQSYDALILDCAPTAESMRFVSLPTALEWYMKRVFKVERNLFRVARPLVKRVTDLPLPDDQYFASIEKMFNGLSGVDRVLGDPTATTVRLVAQPEKMVLKETQRAFMYFCLYGLHVEAVMINKVWPPDVGGTLGEWNGVQERYLELAADYFDPVPIRHIPLWRREVLGEESLAELAQGLYGEADPLERMYCESPLEFVKNEGVMELRLHLPFVHKGGVELGKAGDELVVQAGPFRKHIALPHSFALAKPGRARFQGEHLVIEFTSQEKEAS